MKRGIYRKIHLHSLRKNESAGHFKSFVYGGLDGIITTFAVVAGVAGAGLSSGVLLIMGFANIFADGISLAIGDYLSTRAENEYKASEKKNALFYFKNYPKKEKQDLVTYYMKEGMSRSSAEKLVALMSKNKNVLNRTVMSEELDIMSRKESPLKNAIVTFLSFIIFGFLPLAAYIAESFVDLPGENFATAGILTLIALFTLGSIKGEISGKHWFKSAIETVVIGGLAAFAAYLVGYLLSGIM